MNAYFAQQGAEKRRDALCPRDGSGSHFPADLCVPDPRKIFEDFVLKVDTCSVCCGREGHWSLSRKVTASEAPPRAKVVRPWPVVSHEHAGLGILTA